MEKKYRIGPNFKLNRAPNIAWKDRNVLVTGATGSFGKKLIEILANEYSPKQIIVFSRDELKQAEMQSAGWNGSNIRYFLGDIRDRERLRRAMSEVHIVIHSAALKQVPACEYNPFEAIQTNVIGSRNVIEAALDAGVEKVLALSTDKAVNPTNLYGATKLCAEKLIVQGNSYPEAKSTRLSCVRYGNVVGSRGSVIPLFLKQRPTGTLTVTDADMTRFWITLEQGVRFVIRSLEEMTGGEIFVPKIPSATLKVLASAMAPECAIKMIGPRPGEKRHEELVSEHEAGTATEYEDMFVVRPTIENKAKVQSGKPLPQGFSYRSDNNSWKLGVEEIKQLLANEIPGLKRAALKVAA